MKYNIKQINKILEPFRKESDKYKVFTTYLWHYNDLLWHDIERAIQGLEPLQINKVKDYKEDNKIKVFFSIDKDGMYSVYEVEDITGFSHRTVMTATRKGSYKRKGLIIERIKN